MASATIRVTPAFDEALASLRDRAFQATAICELTAKSFGDDPELAHAVVALRLAVKLLEEVSGELEPLALALLAREDSPKVNRLRDVLGAERVTRALAEAQVQS